MTIRLAIILIAAAISAAQAQSTTTVARALMVDTNNVIISPPDWIASGAATSNQGAKADSALQPGGTASNLTATGTTTNRGSSEWRDSGNTLRASINHTTGAVMIRGLDSHDWYARECVGAMEKNGWTWGNSPFGGEFFWGYVVPTNSYAGWGVNTVVHAPTGKNQLTLKTLWSGPREYPDFQHKIDLTWCRYVGTTNSSSSYVTITPAALVFTNKVASTNNWVTFAVTNTISLTPYAPGPAAEAQSVSVRLYQANTSTNTSTIILRSFKVFFE